MIYPPNLTPAGADPQTPAHAWTSPHFIAEEKMDGWRGLLAFGDSDTPRLLCRNGADRWANVPHLRPSQANGLTVLDGEVLPPVGHGVEAMQTILGASVEKSRKWQTKRGLARFVVFDVLFVDGVDVRELPLSERRTLRDSIVWRDCLACPQVSVVPTATCNLTACYDRVVADGGEGLMVKDLRAVYGLGWFKAKHEEALDVVVMAFGLNCGTARVGQYRDGVLVEVATVAIPSAVERRDLCRDPARYVGRVVEIRTFGNTSGGKCKTPTWVRWRADKPAALCVAA